MCNSCKEENNLSEGHYDYPPHPYWRKRERCLGWTVWLVMNMMDASSISPSFGGFA